jgi:hypothetical protein
MSTAMANIFQDSLPNHFYYPNQFGFYQHNTVSTNGIVLLVQQIKLISLSVDFIHSYDLCLKIRNFIINSIRYINVKLILLNGLLLLGKGSRRIRSN